MGGLAALAQAFHEAQGESLDNLVSLAAQETQQRQALGHVPAQGTAALDEHDFQARSASVRVEGGGLGGHQSGRASTDHQYVHLIAYRNAGGGDFDLFHGLVS